MSQEKNATDDPPRSPPDQGGAVNRSFSIHEIQDMSDDDADGYRAALDERAARRARRCALSAPQAAEAPAHPTAARSPDQPAPTPSGSGNAVSSRRGQHRAIEDGTAGLKPAPTSTGNTTPRSRMAIVAQRVRRKKPQYLVQWAPPYDAHEHMTWQSADDVKNSGKLVKQFEQRREAMQEYDASQRFDFDHLMAPATVVGSTTHAKWSPSISNDDRVRLGAFTAMQLKLERWTNDVL